MSDSRTPSGEENSPETSSNPSDSVDNTTGSQGASSGASLAPTAGQGKKKRWGFVRRHPIILSLVSILVLFAIAVGGYLWNVNNQLNNIQRVDAGIKENPAINGHEGGKPLNILLLGADNGYGPGQSVAADLADGKWTPFVHRSDTMMVVHIPADRKSVQLVSIPRDTWVHINGYPYTNHHGKINAAFAYGGPSLALQTVQQLTGIHIDHLAIIDWAGFKDLTTALGGIRVYIPHTFYDDSQRITWHKGWHTFQGQEALAYVRTRHGLANGDFDRIKRQQNFIRATMSSLLSSGTTSNPFKLAQVVGVITRYLTVDNTWDNSEIRILALALRNISSDNVTFLTAPLGRYGVSSDGQDIVQLAPVKSRMLFRDVAHGDVQRYLAKYPQAKLGNSTSIN